MSSPFHTLVEGIFKKSDLQKVRIKVDPAKACEDNEYTLNRGYEGYILREKDGIAKVFIVKSDEPASIMDIPSADLEPTTSSSSSYDMFKELFLQYLEHDGLIQSNPKVVDIIIQSSDPVELRQLCDYLNIDESYLLKCYESFISN